MPLLIRYLLSDLLKVFLAVLTGMTVLIMLVLVVKQALENGLGPSQIVQVLPYVLPQTLRFAIPGTVLFAACSIYGRMSSSGEIIAIKALGISPMVLIWPTFALMFIISLVTVWINDLAVTWGQSGVQRVLVESIEEIAYGMLSAKRSYSDSQFSITVTRVEGRKLINPTLVLKSNTPQVTVHAEEAVLQAKLQDNPPVLSIVFQRATVDVGDQMTVEWPGTFEQSVPLPTAPNLSETSPSYVPLQHIPDEAERQRLKILRREQQLAADAAFQLLSGDIQELGDARFQNVSLTSERHRLYKLHMEPYRRWASGFSCLCFVMVGVPIAIRLRNADFLTSFFLCFGPILVLYYPLFAYGLDGAKTGALPPYSVWLGNMVLIVIGWWALRKVVRY